MTAHSDVEKRLIAQSEARADRAEFLLGLALACAAQALRRREHTEYWYACRLERLKDLAKRENLWDEVAAIIANGDATRQLPDGSWFHEPPTYAQQLNRALHRADAAERRLANLQREISESRDSPGKASAVAAKAE